MPVDNNGVGYSEYTEEKQEFFNKFISMNINIWKSIISKNRYFEGNYNYFDITAGPGIHQIYGLGSPLLFLKRANEAGIKYTCHLWDKNPETIRNLRINIANGYEGIYDIRTGDHNYFLNEYLKYSTNRIPGLLYCDLNAEIPPFELLGKFSNIWQKIDILINYSGTTVKRRSIEKRIRTSEYMKLIVRKNRMLREPRGRHQWTFLFFTDGPIVEWKREKFESYDSRLGQEYLRKIDYSKNEQPEQLTLSFL